MASYVVKHRLIQQSPIILLYSYLLLAWFIVIIRLIGVANWNRKVYLMVAAAEKTKIIMGVYKWEMLFPVPEVVSTPATTIIDGHVIIIYVSAEDEDDHADDEHSIDGFNLSCGRNWKDNHMSMGEQPANVNDNNNRVGF